MDRYRRAAGRWREGSPRPLALIRAVASREVIVAASLEALSAGIRPGMSLCEGRALCAGLDHAYYDAARDRKAFEALSRWLTRFTPVVSPEAPVEPPQIVTHPSIFLDLTGCERVFGGLDAILAAIRSALDAMRVHAVLAVGPTPGAAYALAYASAMKGDWGPRVLDEADFASELGALPVGGLRLDDSTVATLRHLGLHTIGQFAAMDRKLIAARLGTQALLRFDQASGVVPELLVPLLAPEPIETWIDFDGVIESLELLWPAFDEMIQTICQRLLRQGCGARQLEVTLVHPHSLPVVQTIAFTRPCRDAKRMNYLLRCKLERVSPAPARKTVSRPGRTLHRLPEGFVAVRMVVPACERLGDEQVALMEHEAHIHRVELDRLVDRLRARLGADVVAQTCRVESHVPEKSFERLSVTQDATDAKGAGAPRVGMARNVTRPSRKTKSKTSGKQSKGNDSLHSIGSRDSAPIDSAGALARSDAPLLRIAPVDTPLVMADAFMAGEAPRPLYVFEPREVRVIVSPSHDRDGRPVAFAGEDGQVHTVVHAVGPERIGGSWWDGRLKTRDYFDALLPSGRRMWLFRVCETGKWYVQGEFA